MAAQSDCKHLALEKIENPFSPIIYQCVQCNLWFLAHEAEIKIIPKEPVKSG